MPRATHEGSAPSRNLDPDAARGGDSASRALFRGRSGKTVLPRPPSSTEGLCPRRARPVPLTPPYADGPPRTVQRSREQGSGQTTCPAFPTRPTCAPSWTEGASWPALLHPPHRGAAHPPVSGRSSYRERLGILGRRLGAGTPYHLDLVDYPGEVAPRPAAPQPRLRRSGAPTLSPRPPAGPRTARPFHEALGYRGPRSARERPRTRRPSRRPSPLYHAHPPALDPDALAALPPGRFLMPGDLEGLARRSPFAAAPPAGRRDRPQGLALGDDGKSAMRAYKDARCPPLLPRPFRAPRPSGRCLVDALAALNGGPEALCRAPPCAGAGPRLLPRRPPLLPRLPRGTGGSRRFLFLAPPRPTTSTTPTRPASRAYPRPSSSPRPASAPPLSRAPRWIVAAIGRRPATTREAPTPPSPAAATPSAPSPATPTEGRAHSTAADVPNGQTESALLPRRHHPTDPSEVVSAPQTSDECTTPALRTRRV